MLQKSLGLLAVLLIGSSAGAESLEVGRDLKSAEGVGIQVEFNVQTRVTNSNKPERLRFAEPLELRVEHPGLRTDDQVRAVLTLMEHTENFCGGRSRSQTQVYVMDLRFDADEHAFRARFTEDASLLIDDELYPVRLPLMISSEGFCDRIASQLQVAVVVNGQWLKDPISQTGNFLVWPNSR